MRKERGGLHPLTAQETVGFLHVLPLRPQFRVSELGFKVPPTRTPYYDRKISRESQSLMITCLRANSVGLVLTSRSAALDMGLHSSPGYLGAAVV